MVIEVTWGWLRLCDGYVRVMWRLYDGNVMVIEIMWVCFHLFEGDLDYVMVIWRLCECCVMVIEVKRVICWWLRLSEGYLIVIEVIEVLYDGHWGWKDYVILIEVTWGLCYGDWGYFMVIELMWGICDFDWVNMKVMWWWLK